MIYNSYITDKGAQIMKTKNYLEWMEEAEEILRFTYQRLSDMTTDEFSKGGDKDIRDRIENFLGITYDDLAEQEES